MFGAITYFVIPKSYLQLGVKLHMLVKDEQEPSMTGFPTEVVGQVQIPQGYDSLGQLLEGALFEPGHPETTLEVAIERDARAAQALIVRSQPSKVLFDLTCQPQVFNTDPTRDGSMPEIRPASAGLEQLLGADQHLEEVKDREKWQLLTRELSQK